MLLTVSNTCAAADVWIEHWNSEGVDIYAMDDTITSGTADTGRYFKVSTKFVRNGQLQNVVNWSFSQWHSDNWRYETNTMSGGHTTVVFNNKLFEFCMARLGWSYSKTDGYYH